MIRFEVRGRLLLLIYSPANPWVGKRFQEDEEASLKKGTFTFAKKDLSEGNFDEDEEAVEFVFGRLDKRYYKVEASVLKTRQPVFFHEDVKLSVELFVAAQGISIF